MMVRAFKRRFASIAVGQCIGIVVGAIFIGYEESWVKAFGISAMLGFVTVLAFWHRFFARFPNANAADKIALQTLYRLGQSAFLLASAFFLAMALASMAQSHHWLFFIYFAIELSEHFLFRWIDGNGKFFFQANASDCLGGAAGYAMRRFNNLAQ